MSHYSAPWNENKQLLRATLARAAEICGPDGSAPSPLDEVIANRARLLVAAVNGLPVEVQPEGWILADDPHAEVAYKKDQLHVLNKLLADREREVQAERVLDGKFTVTWNHDFLLLWCRDCDRDEKEVASFAGSPTNLGDVSRVMRDHRFRVHGEVSG